MKITEKESTTARKRYVEKRLEKGYPYPRSNKKPTYNRDQEERRRAQHLPHQKLSSITKEEKRAYDHEYYLKNRGVYRERYLRVKKIREEMSEDDTNPRGSAQPNPRRQLINELRSGPCTDCGNTYPAECMEFDHVPERGKKLFEIATAMSRSAAVFQAELDKCDVVCANCHNIRTATRRWEKKARQKETIE